MHRRRGGNGRDARGVYPQMTGIGGQMGDLPLHPGPLGLIKVISTPQFKVAY